ncbi:hypothetical protein I8751_06460 [Nostocaceae cyanobacterium CENA357]|uniref:Uncharacterized protein n=1 Tax=Atlanticothrix silvestris CENA357 TaxID=1725252 RepID=A0A8J7L4H5_9CYAN|nr:hypothetical protein [Atlanticothrix silvestris]MBH8552022.1 hypothetical protein [Atlanticothrix silvestris CENA357]
MEKKLESKPDNINQQLQLRWIFVGVVGVVFALILLWTWRQQPNKEQATKQCIYTSEFANKATSLASNLVKNDTSISAATIEQLKYDICENLIIKYEYSSTLNWFWNLLMLFSSVGATLALAVADDTKTRALLGCLATSLVSIRSVIPVAQWSTFHRSLAEEGRSLLIRLKYSVKEPNDFQEIVKAYEKAVLRASTDQPNVNLVFDSTGKSTEGLNNNLEPK